MRTREPVKAIQPRHPWEVVEDLMAEAEVQRIEALTDEELRAELRAVGIDPEKVPSPEAFVERGKAIARSRKSQSPAARAPEMVRTMPSAGNTRHGSESAGLRRQALWLAAAVFLLVVGGIALAERSTFATWFAKPPVPHDIAPLDDEEQRRLTATQAHDAAEKARDHAERACGAELWEMCRDKLDEAKALDAAGESEPRVQKMRATMAALSYPAPDKVYELKNRGKGPF